MQFFLTRKFWTPVIALLETVLVWAIPNVLHIDVTTEMQSIIILVLWAIAGLVVHGDIKYDWINAENATKGVEG